jgi:hypothetical protein
MDKQGDGQMKYQGIFFDELIIDNFAETNTPLPPTALPPRLVLKMSLMMAICRSDGVAR